jgi:hypothetical protein
VESVSHKQLTGSSPDDYVTRRFTIEFPTLGQMKPVRTSARALAMQADGIISKGVQGQQELEMYLGNATGLTVLLFNFLHFTSHHGKLSSACTTVALSSSAQLHKLSMPSITYRNNEFNTHTPVAASSTQSRVRDLALSSATLALYIGRKFVSLGTDLHEHFLYAANRAANSQVIQPADGQTQHDTRMCYCALTGLRIKR